MVSLFVYVIGIIVLFLILILLLTKQTTSNPQNTTNTTINLTTSITTLSTITTNPTTSTSTTVKITTVKTTTVITTTSTVPTTTSTILTTTTVPTSTACNQSLWNHVYNSYRLKVINSCITVSGTIYAIRTEKDGDYHILLSLDPKYANLTNSGNNQDSIYGNLVVEPICQHTVTQSDAISSCANFTYYIYIPPIGSHVQVTGSYVLDTEHYYWAEIHPVSSISQIP